MITYVVVECLHGLGGWDVISRDAFGDLTVQNHPTKAEAEDVAEWLRSTHPVGRAT
jgi:hypothetical protein